MIARFRGAMTSVGDYGLLLWETAYWVLPARLRRRRGGIPTREIFVQLDRLAFGILPLAGIVLLFVGMILALQLAGILQLLGVVEYVPTIVGVAMVREMAPLLIGVVLAGFAGAAIAAEIGSMKVSEEVQALESLALQPGRYLMAPRLLAAIIAAPLITTFGIYVGIAGGLWISSLLLGISPGMYLQRTLAAISGGDVALGLVKGEVFGVIVAGVACFEGMRVEGGALGVGRATTAAVVKSIVAIIAADLFLTVLFFNLP
ncbi:MAG: ABC transporter permease [Planctomycetes bacterium]|nr:ABC transporter permease [Planctomycetota bacterium]